MNKITNTRIRCPKCLKYDFMQIVTEGNIYRHDSDYNVDIQVLCCKNCYQIIVLSTETDVATVEYVQDVNNETVTERYDRTETILYPKLFRDFRNLPSSVQKAYNSAGKVFNVDNTAFVTMAGRTLEIACKELGATGKYLDNKINYLASKGLLPSYLKDIASKLRVLRNISLHNEITDISRQDADIVRLLLEAILEHLYELPKIESNLRELSKKLKVD